FTGSSAVVNYLMPMSAHAAQVVKRESSSDAPRQTRHIPCWLPSGIARFTRHALPGDPGSETSQPLLRFNARQVTCLKRRIALGEQALVERHAESHNPSV